MASRTVPVPQAQVTSNIGIDPDLYKRMKRQGMRTKARIYPVTSEEDLAIKRHELVFGLCNQPNTLAGHRPGRSTEFGFTSFNGLSLEEYAFPEDLANNIYLIGAALGNHEPNSREQVNNDLAVMRFGVVDIAYDMVNKICYPGDILIWQPPEFPDEITGQARQLGSSNQRPPSKLLGSLTPFNPVLITDYFVGVFERMMSGTKGVYGLSLGAFNSGLTKKGLSADDEAALALKQFSLFGGLQTIYCLMTRELLKIMTPEAHEHERAVTNLNQVLDSGTDLDRDLLDAIRTYRDTRAAIVETDPIARTNMNYRTENREHEVPVLTAPSSYFKEGVNMVHLSVEERYAIQKRDHNALLYLAKVLGAIGSKEDVSLIVQEDVLYHIFCQFAMTSLNDPSFAPKFVVKHPLAVEYAERALYAPKLLGEAMASLIHAMNRRIAGIALTFGEGRRQNERVDVFMGGGMGVHV